LYSLLSGGWLPPLMLVVELSPLMRQSERKIQEVVERF